jgi:purine-binding chemotaxis protein CheW
MASEVESSTGVTTLGQPSAATSGEDKSTATYWLLCRAGSHQLALPVPKVIETMRMLPIEPLAGAPPMVRGLCIIRGAPAPVVDTALVFDNCHCERLVTVRTGERTIAFAMDSVLGVQAIRAEELERLPPLLSNVQMIAGVKALDEELVFFPHTARILPDDILDRCIAEGTRT